MSPSSNRTERGFIYLDGVEYDLEIGIHDFERGKTQRFVMDVEVEFDPELINISEDIAQVFDYDQLKACLDRLAYTRGYKLQESFCRAAAEDILKMDGVKRVTIKTAKPDVFENVRAVGVVLEVSR